jgi:hypothetical protein
MCSRSIAANVVNRSPSTDRAILLVTPRPSGTRTRYASTTAPDESSAALGAPTQFPGPLPGGNSTTVALPIPGRGTRSPSVAATEFIFALSLLSRQTVQIPRSKA